MLLLPELITHRTLHANLGAVDKHLFKFDKQKRNLASEYNPASNYAWQLNVVGKHNSVLFKLNFISNNRKTGLHIYSTHIHTAIMEHHHSKSERMTAATKVSWIHFLYPPTLNIMVQVLSHINLPVDLAALLIFVN